jgi:hypothetical protein
MGCALVQPGVGKVAMKSKAVAWPPQRIQRVQVEALGFTVMRQADCTDRMGRAKDTVQPQQQGQQLRQQQQQQLTLVNVP